MTAAQQLRYSYEDFLRVLDSSDLKLEYSAGLIYAMAGGTVAHGQLSVNASSLLRSALLGRCIVVSSDVKVRIEETDFAAFPDASVVCGEMETSRIDTTALTNPSIIVEVTSRSTEVYDRGEKLEHYQRLPSVKAVLLVSHRERRVTLVERSDGRWATRDLVAGEHVALRTPECGFAVDELYADVTLDPR